jgi:hypothetical protein
VLVKHRGVAKQGGMDIDQPLGMIFEVVDGRARRVRGWIEWEDALRAAGLDPAQALAG